MRQKNNKSIEQFSNQYPISASHHFFYFGDIDKEWDFNLVFIIKANTTTIGFTFL
ncbi:hypothetical protein KHA80_21675 [Anaerobacillus sp. HL2]|nr:hypothetical protein KHA80_21675 [Anaerobacillus sp. HL2]